MGGDFSPKRDQPSETRAMNFRVSQELFDRVAGACERLGITKQSFTEQAMEYALENLEAPDLPETE